MEIHLYWCRIYEWWSVPGHILRARRSEATLQSITIIAWLHLERSNFLAESFPSYIYAESCEWIDTVTRLILLCSINFREEKLHPSFCITNCVFSFQMEKTHFKFIVSSGNRNRRHWWRHHRPRFGGAFPPETLSPFGHFGREFSF